MIMYVPKTQLELMEIWLSIYIRLKFITIQHNNSTICEIVY